VRTYEKIMNLNALSEGILVTGQPGIGEFFAQLLYVLWAGPDSVAR
jgi:hypothetical protein